MDAHHHGPAHAPDRPVSPLDPHDLDHHPLVALHAHHDPAPTVPLWLRVRSAWTRLMIQLYVPSILAGLFQTFLYMVRPKTTLQYPEQKHVPRKGYRGEHRLKKDEQGREKCVACFMCATACPAECITIEAGEAPWPDRDKYPVKFEIDMLKCIYCGMCEEACPCDAIELTETYTQVATSRAEKIYDKERLLRN
jgi:NADH-quinone oxidoreductase subunit I